MDSLFLEVKINTLKQQILNFMELVINEINLFLFGNNFNIYSFFINNYKARYLKFDNHF